MTDPLPDRTDVDDARSRRAGLAANFRTVGGWTLLSRVLGMVRDVAMAVTFGNGVVLDAFTVAFRVPNLFRRLFGEGALTAAFLPALIRERREAGDAAAWRLASTVFALLTVVLTGVVVACELLLAVGLASPVSPATRLLLELTALLLPYLVLICLAAQVSVVLHTLNHFAWPAIVPVLLNVVWIAGLLPIVLWIESPVERIHAIAACVVAAGVVQLLAPLPTLFRLGFRFSVNAAREWSRVKPIAAAMLPVLVGLTLVQVNTLIDSLIAWGLSAPEAAAGVDPWPETWHPLLPGTASAMWLGQRMYQFPLGLLGVALGTVLFPTLTRHAESGRFDRLREDLGLGLRIVLGIGLPASLGLVLLAEPITELLFRHGNFDALDARQTAAMIAGYGLGVWAYSGIPVMHRAFYAVGDRTSPIRIGLVAVALNLLLDFTLVWPLGGQGLAFATAAAATAQILALVWLVQAHVGPLDWENLLSTTLRATLATLLMAAVCLAALRWLPAGEAIAPRLLRVAVPFTAAVATFVLAAKWLGLDEVRMLLRFRSDDEHSPRE